MNSFGRIFRVTIWGESHGQQIGVSVDGVPAGICLCEDDFAADLDRRRSGSKGTTPRRESDAPRVVSGLFEGFTTGAPLSVVFENENTISKDYSNLVTHPRPSHADWVADQKFGGFQDYRGGGHFSGRLTLPFTAAGVVAKRVLGDDITFLSSIVELGGSKCKDDFDSLIADAMRSGDSVGAVIECRVSGVPVGLGEPFFGSVESSISQLLFSVPAVKGVEFGAGFGVASARGSQNNDPIIDAQGHTATNHDGGINGGITNGNDIVFRVAIKPTPSISCEQMTFDSTLQSVEPLVIKGRHDACIALRAAVVVEAAAAIALADLSLCQRQISVRK